MIRQVSKAPAPLRSAVLALVIGASALAAAPGAALAGSAPANDSFASATQIAYLPFEDSFVDNASATLENGETDNGCYGDIDATVWYRITPSRSYAIRVRVIPVNGFDPVLGVHEASSINDLLPISCEDPGWSGETETAIVSLISGHSYFIQVGNLDSADTGQFTVKVKRLAGPANDHFANASTLALGSITTAATTTATIEADEPAPSCGYSIGRTVWYRYTPTTTRTVVVNTIGSGFDTVLAAYTGSSVGALNGIACNDDRGVDLASKIRFRVVAGNTYYFQVGGYWGQGGELVLRLKTP